MTATPEIGWFWIRRSLWKRGRDLDALARWSYFDAIFEPLELCSNEDVGPTTTERSRVVEVPPPLLLEKEDLLSRDVARKELGIRNDEFCVAIQLGSGSNFDFSGIRNALVEDLQRRPGIRLFELHSPITSQALKSPEEGVQPLVCYPSVRISAGFDLMISSAGYNGFHENLCHGIPTIFVPNESYEMDDQLLRARYAESMGFALTLRANEIWRVSEVLDMAIDESFRLRSRQSSFVIENGAADIARIIEEAASSLRVGRPLGDSINRI
jgi:UDP:flavonoid glycosyltransferase YjiC (YdhE family)